MKLLEDGSKEACGVDGVYMVLRKQRRWDRFECRWAVGQQQATIEQEVVCRLYGFFCTDAVWGRQLDYFVQVRAETTVVCQKLINKEVWPKGEGKSVVN